jgi:hypothetical protein
MLSDIGRADSHEYHYPCSFEEIGGILRPSINPIGGRQDKGKRSKNSRLISAE